MKRKSVMTEVIELLEFEYLVRERAYYKWQNAGSPEDHAETFWLQAEEELRNELLTGRLKLGQKTS